MKRSGIQAYFSVSSKKSTTVDDSVINLTNNSSSSISAPENIATNDVCQESAPVSIDELDIGNWTGKNATDSVKLK